MTSEESHLLSQEGVKLHNPYPNLIFIHDPLYNTESHSEKRRIILISKYKRRKRAINIILTWLITVSYLSGFIILITFMLKNEAIRNFLYIHNLGAPIGLFGGVTTVAIWMTCTLYLETDTFSINHKERIRWRKILKK